MKEALLNKISDFIRTKYGNSFVYSKLVDIKKSMVTKKLLNKKEIDIIDKHYNDFEVFGNPLGNLIFRSIWNVTSPIKNESVEHLLGEGKITSTKEILLKSAINIGLNEFDHYWGFREDKQSEIVENIFKCITKKTGL